MQGTEEEERMDSRATVESVGSHSAVLRKVGVWSELCFATISVSSRVEKEFEMGRQETAAVAPVPDVATVVPFTKRGNTGRGAEFGATVMDALWTCRMGSMRGHPSGEDHSAPNPQTTE